MATPDTRRILASRRRNERDRKRAQRERDREAHVPPQYVIDGALALAIRRMVIERHGGLRHLPADSDLHALMTGATAILNESGYNPRSPRARVLLRRTLGDVS